jgi:hypothetical protein
MPARNFECSKCGKPHKTLFDKRTCEVSHEIQSSATRDFFCIKCGEDFDCQEEYDAHQLSLSHRNRRKLHQDEQNIEISSQIGESTIQEPSGLPELMLVDQPQSFDNDLDVEIENPPSLESPFLQQKCKKCN